MEFKKEWKKYLDLPYFLILISVFAIIRQFIYFDYSDFKSNSFDQIGASILTILVMIFVIKVWRKNEK